MRLRETPIVPAELGKPSWCYLNGAQSLHCCAEFQSIRPHRRDVGPIRGWIQKIYSGLNFLSIYPLQRSYDRQAEQTVLPCRLFAKRTFHSVSRRVAWLLSPRRRIVRTLLAQFLIRFPKWLLTASTLELSRSFHRFITYLSRCVPLFPFSSWIETKWNWNKWHCLLLGCSHSYKALPSKRCENNVALREFRTFNACMRC